MQLLLGIVASATGAAGSVTYIGLKGNTYVGWREICTLYGKFCRYLGASIGVSLFASVMLVLLVLLSVYSLSKKIPKWLDSYWKVNSWCIAEHPLVNVSMWKCVCMYCSNLGSLYVWPFSCAVGESRHCTSSCIWIHSCNCIDVEQKVPDLHSLSSINPYHTAEDQKHFGVNCGKLPVKQIKYEDWLRHELATKLHI